MAAGRIPPAKGLRQKASAAPPGVLLAAARPSGFGSAPPSCGKPLRPARNDHNSGLSQVTLAPAPGTV